MKCPCGLDVKRKVLNGIVTFVHKGDETICNSLDTFESDMTRPYVVGKVWTALLAGDFKTINIYAPDKDPNGILFTVYEAIMVKLNESRKGDQRTAIINMFDMRIKYDVRLKFQDYFIKAFGRSGVKAIEILHEDQFPDMGVTNMFLFSSPAPFKLPSFIPKDVKDKAVERYKEALKKPEADDEWQKIFSPLERDKRIRESTLKRTLKAQFKLDLNKVMELSAEAMQALGDQNTLD